MLVSDSGDCPVCGASLAGCATMQSIDHPNMLECYCECGTDVQIPTEVVEFTPPVKVHPYADTYRKSA